MSIDARSRAARLDDQRFPPRRTCPPQELIEESTPVAWFQPQPRGVRGDAMGDVARIVEAAFQDLPGDLGHGIHVNVVCEER